MAAGILIKHKRKTGAFANGELAAGELGVDITNSVIYFSINGTTVISLGSLYQPLDSDLTTIAGLAATTDNFLVSVSSAWASRTPAQVKTTLALNLVDNTSNATERAATASLTAKTLIATSNVVEEITTTASSATPTPTGGSLRNFFTVTALAEGATFAAPSGSPANGNYLTIRILDNGTTRTLAWNAIYRVIGVTLPTATTANKTVYVGCRYNSADSKWDVLATGVQV